jgi:hypothetical protein
LEGFSQSHIVSKDSTVNGRVAVILLIEIQDVGADIVPAELQTVFLVLLQ